MTKFEQFLANIPNQAIEVSDSSNEYQCMDLAYLWVFCLGYPKATIQHRYAYEVYTNPSPLTLQYFDIIPNSPTAVPQQGDLVVWGTAVGVAGHIAIATGKGDTKVFESLDQNWKGLPGAVLVSHTYGTKNAVLGWLRPKTLNDHLHTDKDWQEERDARNVNWEGWQAEKTQHGETKKELSIIQERLEQEKKDRLADLEKIGDILFVQADLSKIIPAIETCIKFEDKATELQKKLDEERAMYEKKLKDLQEKFDSLERQFNVLKEQLDQLKEEKPEPVIIEEQKQSRFQAFISWLFRR